MPVSSSLDISVCTKVVDQNISVWTQVVDQLTEIAYP